MPKLELDAIPQTNATDYPPPHAGAVQGRRQRRLGPAAGLTDFGPSHLTPAPVGEACTQEDGTPW